MVTPRVCPESVVAWERLRAHVPQPQLSNEGPRDNLDEHLHTGIRSGEGDPDSVWDRDRRGPMGHDGEATL